MRKTILILILPLLFIFVVGAACQINLGGPDIREEDQPTPQTVIPTISIPDTDTPGNGSITITLTEDQLTELVRERLSASDDSLIKDPRVILQNGQIELHGQAEQGLLSGTFKATAQVEVDAEGRPDLEITSAVLGPLPVPESVLESVSTMIEESFTSNLGSYATGFRIDQIIIDSGVMTITGQPR